MAWIPQDHRKATYLRKRNKEDGLIRWEEGAMKAYNLIRASPWRRRCPKFFERQRDKNLGRAPTWFGCRGNGRGHVPGEIISVKDEGLVVWAHDGSLLITDLEMEPRRFTVGEVFGNG